MLQDLSNWVGREETVVDWVTPSQTRALAATLEAENAPVNEGDALPFMWQWIFCTVKAPRREIGADGHPKKGGFLPPVPLPRRMFAGATMAMLEPIRVGTEIRKTSTIVDVSEKSGKSGPLAFVKVRHVYSTDGVINMIDTHDIVYREEASDAVPAVTPIDDFSKPPANAVVSRIITPDNVLLFRYSALIFVSHRIHYDRPYTMEEEGYPGLLVHGPLIATLLAELARNAAKERTFTRMHFRAKMPVFDNNPFRVSMLEPDSDGRHRLVATRADGVTAMSGQIG